MAGHVRCLGIVGGREVVLTEGTPGRFDEVAEQYRIERGS